MKSWFFLAIALAAVMLAGCRTGNRNQARVDGDEELEYELLPLLRRSHHDGLQEELARLESERATPVLLVADASKRRLDAHGPLADESNVAKALAKVCQPDMARILCKEAQGHMPGGGFKFSPGRLREAAEFRIRYEELRKKFRQALQLSHCDFGLKATDGIKADTTFVEIAKLGFYLEAIHAAELLHTDRPQEALDSLFVMFRMAAFLRLENHLIPRLTAARMQQDALRVLEAIANHQHTVREIQEQLVELVAAQLTAWPNERGVWVDQRAAGLQIYEIVRDGYLTSLLSKERIEQIEKQLEISIDLFATDKIRNADDDQLFYLEAMRRVIDGSQYPYYQRTKDFLHIRNELEKRRVSSQYPFVADEIIRIGEIQQSQQILALERALTEAWLLALSHAIGRPREDLRTNPLTGKPYQIQKKERLVQVWEVRGRHDESPLEVRLLSPSANDQGATATSQGR